MNRIVSICNFELSIRYFIIFFFCIIACSKEDVITIHQPHTEIVSVQKSSITSIMVKARFNFGINTEIIEAGFIIKDEANMEEISRIKYIEHTDSIHFGEVEFDALNIDKSYLLYSYINYGDGIVVSPEISANTVIGNLNFKFSNYSGDLINDTIFLNRGDYMMFNLETNNSLDANTFSLVLDENEIPLENENVLEWDDKFNYNLNVNIPTVLLPNTYTISYKIDNIIFSTNLKLKILDGSWSELDKGPRPGNHSTSIRYNYFKINDFGYVANTNMHYEKGIPFKRYNFTTNEWEILSNIPINSINGYDNYSRLIFTTQVNNIAYAFIKQYENYPSKKHFNEMWKYDPEVQTWEFVSEFTEEVHYDCIHFTLGSKIYFGVWDSRYIGSIEEKYSSWSFDTQTNKWGKITNCPIERRKLTAHFTYKNCGYLILGGNNFYPDHLDKKSDIWKYDPQTNAWSKIGEFPGIQRFSSQAITLGENIYIIGGEKTVNYYYETVSYKECWKFEIESGKWSRVANPPIGFDNGVIFTHNNLMYSGLGGTDEEFNYRFFVFDLNK